MAPTRPSIMSEGATTSEPARAWQMDQEGSTAWHTKLAFVVRYNKQRHGLVPVRPHVILCNEITLKPSTYTMLIGRDESDA